jgi:hypothetical protein
MRGNQMLIHLLNSEERMWERCHCRGWVDLIYIFKCRKICPPLIILSIILASLLVSNISMAVDNNSEYSSGMMKLISENEDDKMTVNDLAFFLATHGFDAVPKKDYVEVHLDSTIYRLAPNGQAAGLASVPIAS